MKLKIFMSLIFVLSAICILIHAIQPNHWLMLTSLWSMLIGLFSPVFVSIYKGELKILVE